MRIPEDCAPGTFKLVRRSVATTSTLRPAAGSAPNAADNGNDDTAEQGDLMAQAERYDSTPERVDDNEVEMRGRILEQQTGGATPWTRWSRYATSPGAGLTGIALDAAAAAVRHTILPGYIATTRVSRVIETADGQPVRTVEYEFRTVGDGRRGSSGTS